MLIGWRRSQIYYISLLSHTLCNVIHPLIIPLSTKEIPQIGDLIQIRGMKPGDLDTFLTTRHHGFRFSYVIYQSYQSSEQLSPISRDPQIGDLIPSV